MQNVSTKIWTTAGDERYDREITVDYAVIDLDEAARLLEFTDYIDLRLKCENVKNYDELADEDEVLNFKNIPHE